MSNLLSEFSIGSEIDSQRTEYLSRQRKNIIAAYRDDYGMILALTPWGINKNIEKFWTEDCDNLLLTYIKKYEWYWIEQESFYKEIFSIIQKNVQNYTTDVNEIDKIFKDINKSTNLPDFSANRAYILGYTKNIRPGEIKKCPICGEQFHEKSISYFHGKTMGIDRLEICEPCIERAYLPYFQAILPDDEQKEVEKGNYDYLKDSCREFIKFIYKRNGIIPDSRITKIRSLDLKNLSLEERIHTLSMIHHSAAIQSYKKIYGNWFKTLMDAGFFTDGYRETSRGTQCIAEDGHFCLSIAEKSIDDYLFSHKIMHDKEPHYPEGNYRADFKIGEYFVEYFGLAGVPEYDKKIKIKRKIAKRHGIQLIEVFPSDLIGVDCLNEIFGKFI